MKRAAIHQAMSLAVAACLLLLAWVPAQAQGQNLLTNPGFENPYTTLDGSPPRQVAQGWTPWHVPPQADAPSFQNRQPEYYPTAPDTTRIRNGNNAQQLLSFFATHDGGVFQRVSGITPGAQLRFSVFAYVWSTTFDDVSQSEEDGDVLVQVGIDPTGGTDGQSTNIIWSRAVEQYDAYREYSITATASGNAVTVFVRTTVGFPVKNNNIYLDDASLTASGQPPAATNTAAAPPTTRPPSATPTAQQPPTTAPTVAAPTNTPIPPPTQVQATATAGDIGIITSTPLPAASNTPIPPTVVPPTAVPTSVPPSATLVPTVPPSAIPTPTAIPSPTPETPTTPIGPISDVFPSTITHSVRAGDTVGNIATLYDSTINAIIDANGLDSSALIRVGQRLIIPVRLPAPATAVPSATPLVSPTPGPGQPPPQTGTDGGTVYVVRPGDTLFGIAVRFNTTVTALSRLNGIVNPNVIQVGQRLNVPGAGQTPPASATPTVTPAAPQGTPEVTLPEREPATYIIQPGDTLFRISLRFNVPLSALAQANNIVDPNRIFIGQILLIP